MGTVHSVLTGWQCHQDSARHVRHAEIIARAPGCVRANGDFDHAGVVTPEECRD